MSNENMERPNRSGADKTTTMLKWAVVILSVILVILVGILIALLVGDKPAPETTPSIPETTQPTESTAPVETTPVETTVPV